MGSTAFCKGCEEWVALLDIRPWPEFGIRIGECPLCSSTLCPGGNPNPPTWDQVLEHAKKLAHAAADHAVAPYDSPEREHAIKRFGAWYAVLEDDGVRLGLYVDPARKPQATDHPTDQTTPQEAA